MELVRRARSIEALQAIGLPKQAAVVAKAISYFQPPYPTDTQERRQVLAPKDGTIQTDLDRRLEALTSEAEAGGEIRAEMTAFAKREGILPH